jgi:hypothetical protein
MVVILKGGSTSRVMAADRLYGEFYYFYSVSQEYFGYTLVVLCDRCMYSPTPWRRFLLPFSLWSNKNKDVQK